MKKLAHDPASAKRSTVSRRPLALGVFFFLLLILVLFRYAWIAVIPDELRMSLLMQAKKQLEEEIFIAPQRSEIVDRNGHILALSVPRKSIFLLTKRMPRDPQQLSGLAHQLRIPLEQLQGYLAKNIHFVWLYRQISLQQFAQLGDLKKWANCLGVSDEPKRIYPEKDVAAHLIGFVGQDNVGLEGVEKTFDERLRGKKQKIQVMRDAMGRIFSTVSDSSALDTTVNPPLVLSIDLFIQRIVENALAAEVMKTNAHAASGVVVDVKTGEILALASYPSFDLNKPPIHDANAMQFHPVVDALELGSVVKPILIANVIDAGLIDPNLMIWTNHGRMKIPGGTIHDTTSAFGFLSIPDIIRYSSNIGTYLVVSHESRELFNLSFVRSGLTRSPGTGLPGEWSGREQHPEKWSVMRFANMAFGQGVAISPLQLAHAITVVAGGGKDRGLHILKQPLENAGAEETVGPPIVYVRPETANLIIEMMRGVITVDKLAKIEDVDIAGKTGTAQQYDVSRHAYSHTRHVDSFEGIFPAENPQIAVVISIDSPKVKNDYALTIAAPVFSDVGQQIAKYYNSKKGVSLNSTP